MSKVMCYDNETIKWNHNGVNYCLHIKQENDACFDPRPEEHDSIMACFGDYRNYGDRKDEDTEEDFWNNLVWNHCDDDEIFNSLINGTLPTTRAKKDEDDTYHISSLTYDGEWIPFCWGLNENEVITYAKDDFSIADCMKLMESHAVWLPLYIYDHSGVSMSCGIRTYPCNDRWDSSQCGWIITVTSDKEQALKQMIAEVNEYDNYLQGYVYWYTLYREGNGTKIYDEVTDGWTEIDSCGGFIGDDIIENGMTYNVGNGIEEAIKNENYTTGTAKKTVVVKWEF